MRIVAGKFRAKRIEAPKGLTTRPTSDRVRQALFNVLEHGAPQFDFAGARVLDLFAGSGALGLEAMSRAARFCLFVEESADARASIRRNVEALSLTGITKIWRRMDQGRRYRGFGGSRRRGNRTSGGVSTARRTYLRRD